MRLILNPGVSAERNQNWCEACKELVLMSVQYNIRLYRKHTGENLHSEHDDLGYS